MWAEEENEEENKEENDEDEEEEGATTDPYSCLFLLTLHRLSLNKTKEKVLHSNHIIYISCEHMLVKLLRCFLASW